MFSSNITRMPYTPAEGICLPHDAPIVSIQKQFNAPLVHVVAKKNTDNVSDMEVHNCNPLYLSCSNILGKSTGGRK